MNSTKTFSYVFKVLTAVSAAATAVLFFFDFFAIKGHYTLSGIQVIFGSNQNGVATYKSAWFLTLFIIAVVTLLFAIVNTLKGKAYKYLTFASSAFLAINALTVYCSGKTKYFDYRPLVVTSNDITREIAVTIMFIAALATFVLAVIALFVADYAEVKESNGAKLPILTRIKNFFKDYKSEITKIVWPSKNTVVKNVISVLVICVIVGAFIWVLDYGLVALINLVIGNK